MVMVECRENYPFESNRPGTGTESCSAISRWRNGRNQPITVSDEPTKASNREVKSQGQGSHCTWAILTP